MKLKLGHSYLIATYGSVTSRKAVVLDVTNTLYHIRWDNGDESWHSKEKFGTDGTTYIVQQEIGKAVIIEPDEYRSMIKRLADRLSDAAAFYEQLEKKREFTVTQGHKRALLMDAQLMRETIKKAKALISEK